MRRCILYDNESGRGELRGCDKPVLRLASTPAVAPQRAGIAPQSAPQGSLTTTTRYSAPVDLPCLGRRWG